MRFIDVGKFFPARKRWRGPTCRRHTIQNRSICFSNLRRAGLCEAIGFGFWDWCLKTDRDTGRTGFKFQQLRFICLNFISVCVRSPHSQTRQISQVNVSLERGVFMSRKKLGTVDIVGLSDGKTIWMIKIASRRRSATFHFMKMFVAQSDAHTLLIGRY